MQQSLLSAWDLFVLRHRKLPNLALHFVSFVLYFGCIPAALVFWNPWLLLGLPLSGPVGTIGHYLFKDGGVKFKEATYDPKVPFFVGIMFYKIVRRQYQQDIVLAENRLNELRGQP